MNTYAHDASRKAFLPRRMTVAECPAGNDGPADRRMIEVGLTKIDSIAVGPRARAGFEIGILPYAGNPGIRDGFLGLDFLAGFRYQVDVAERVIRWQ